MAMGIIFCKVMVRFLRIVSGSDRIGQSENSMSIENPENQRAPRRAAPDTDGELLWWPKQVGI
jgi:hypothetical protein